MNSPFQKRTVFFDSKLRVKAAPKKDAILRFHEKRLEKQKSTIQLLTRFHCFHIQDDVCLQQSANATSISAKKKQRISRTISGISVRLDL